MVMTKADIIESVYEKVGGFSKKEAAEIVETVFDTSRRPSSGARRSRSPASETSSCATRTPGPANPQTGQEITISARRVLTFKPSQVLKNVLND